MSALGFLRTATAACLAVACGSVVVTSCMTPEFTFDDGGSGVATGGDGSQGGSGSGGGATVDHCENRTKDADETDKDCGGLDCSPCALGRACETDGDCVNGACTLSKCQNPSCTDGVKNGTETGEDCGGNMDCGPCEAGQPCTKADDCSSKVCTSGKCKEATCSDRKLNQNEVDVDCGGECEPCDVGRACVVKADCQAPDPTMVEPEADAQPSCAADMTCALDCNDSSRGDCNAAAADGCETSLLTDVANCGACGEPCAPDHATPKCQGGLCGVDACVDGYYDWDNDPSNGCEVNLNTDPEHCGDPFTSCSTVNGTPSCVAGQCHITCAEGFDDCNGDVSDGCEINLDTDTKHCGKCSGAGSVCGASGPTKSPFCADGQCGETDCPSGKGDCDGDTVCSDDLNTAKNCGVCGTNCTVTNGTAACTSPGSGSPCSIGSCDSGFADCDGNYVNGCEIDVTSNKFHCGGCTSADANPGLGKDCDAITKDASKHVAAAACSGGGCIITSCVGSWADCDGAFSNGCEIDTSSNAENCGGCKVAAPGGAGPGDNCLTKYANATGQCISGACGNMTCKANFLDCDTNVATGCEIDKSNDKDNCNGCGLKCLTDSVTSQNTCVSGACNPICTGNGAKCDSNGYNGCEDRNTDANNCGACGTVCATDSVTSSNTCSAASCVPMCIAAAGGMSCDLDGTNGCEDTKSDPNNCGGCNIKCDTSANAHVTVAGGNPCTDSVCVPVCSGTYGNCDGNGANGCETNKAADANNCGACGNKCGGAAGTGVASASCSATGGGTCNVTCNNGMCPDTSAARACTAPLGTMTNCSTCGEACAAGDLCSPSGCVDHLPIVKVNDTTTTVIPNGHDLSLTHHLDTPASANSYRAVVLLLGNTSNIRPPLSTVTYDGKPMTKAIDRDSGNQSWAGIYYILNANLPTTSKDVTIFADGNDNNPQDWTARVIELTNVDQVNALAGAVAAGQGGTGCGSGGNLTVPTTTDSFVVSALVEQRTGESATATDGQTVWPVLVAGDNTMSHGYLENVASGGTQVRWSCSDNEWAHVVAAFNAVGMGS